MRDVNIATVSSRHSSPSTRAPSEQAAKDRFAEFTAEWGQRYPAIVRLWEASWTEFVPFLEYDVEIRRVICTTNAIESINARYRRTVRARGHFPNETAALKCLYLVTKSLNPTGGGRRTLRNHVEACAKRVRVYLRGPVRRNHSVLKTGRTPHTVYRDSPP